MARPSVAIALCTLALAGPARAADAPAQNAPAKDDRVAALEARVAALEQKVTALAAQGAEKERMAQQAGAEIQRLANAGNLAEARAKLDEFMGLYASTAAAQSLGRLRQELEVVGKAAPAKLDVEKWVKGGPEVPQGKATLLVFFEQWCPHCKREVPKVEALHAQFKDQGLVVIGLTRQTRNVTDEQLAEFVSGISYPIAKESGALSQYFNVSGIPAAAIIKDGKVVWRGNPTSLDAEKVKAFLG